MCAVYDNDDDLANRSLQLSLDVHAGNFILVAVRAKILAPKNFITHYALRIPNCPSRWLVDRAGRGSHNLHRERIYNLLLAEEKF